MNRIAAMLGMSADKIRGLQDITVEKIDLFKDRNVLRLVLSGLPEADNNLVGFANEIKRQTECDLKLFFTSVTRENVDSYVRNLNPYIIYTLTGSSSELCYADKCRFEVDEELKLKVTLDAVFDMFVDSPIKRKIESAVMNFTETVLNVRLEGSYLVLSELESEPDTDYCDMYFDEGDMAPPPPMPADAYMPYIPPEIMAEAQEQTRLQEEKEKEAAGRMRRISAC